jgi:ABC-type polysaccharide/polyol phosphate export permease
MTALAVDSLLVARRNLAPIRQIPEKLLDVTLQPLMFVLLFAFVFGGVIAVPHGNYREYLIGGILVQTIAVGMMGPGTSLATDLTEGIVDRFRTLPMARSAFLIGHMLAELAGMLVAIAILSVTGFVVGWRIHAGVPDALAGYGLLVCFALTMVWVGLLVGVSVRSPDAVMGIGFMVVFPLTFVASTFVPVAGLPAGLRQFAEWNPVTALAAAVRGQFGNPTAVPTGRLAWPLAHPVGYSLLFCAAILAVVVPLTIRQYRARTSD